jgi:hypothetical protein
MSFRVVLDANVIVCLPVCDTMLRLAEADVEEIDRLEPHMANAAEDRHVLAAAVAGAAQAVVTSNLRDFPKGVCEPFGIEAIHPDDFLVMQLTLEYPAVRAALSRQASELRRPPVTLDVVLDALHSFVPRFVQAFRTVPHI